MRYPRFSGKLAAMIDPLNDGMCELALGKMSELNDQTHQLHIVCWIPRPGSSEFFCMLEEAFYKPGTPANDLLDMRMLHWEGRPWVICSVPLSDRSKVDAVAATTKMRIADGIPIMVDYPGHERVSALISVRPKHVPAHLTVKATFPLNSRRTFVLENLHPKATKGVVAGVMIGEETVRHFWQGMENVRDKINREILADRAKKN